MIRKSASCQVYGNSGSSDTSVSTSSSDSYDKPLRRFNRLLRVSVARHWGYFRRQRFGLKARGRSVSDAGLCTIVNNDPDAGYSDDVPVRHSLQAYAHSPMRCTVPMVPSLYVQSSGGAGTAGAEEASDSDAERVKKHHLRVPTPAFIGQSTGNFSAGAAGGGGGAPRSAPATPLQLQPHPRKHDKHVVKPLSGSEPSVQAAVGSDAAAEGKQPSKARQKKFYRHFPQVGPDERVLNYYSCALVGDLLLQGHLYITKNYFAFYSNVFGYVTKLLIPTKSVLRITKEKVARIIPNAVGVCTRDERHVFGSLLSRDTTYKLMMQVWKNARMPETLPSKPTEGRVSEPELEASEYSPEDDSSCSGEPTPGAIIQAAAGAAVIQPSLAAAPVRVPLLHRALLAALALLLLSAARLAYCLYTTPEPHDLEKLSTSELYTEIVRWRTNLHTRAASELHTFLTTNLLLLTKVRQSLEALSGVILTDLDQNASGNTKLDLPNETFS